MKKQRLFSNVNIGKYGFSIVLFLCFFLLTPSPIVAQESSISKQQITLRVQKATLDQTLQRIGSASGYYMLYKVADVAHIKEVSINERAISVENALNEALKDSGLTYEVKDKTIVIFKDREDAQKPVVEKRTLTGRVTDEGGAALSGVTVLAGSTGAITDLQGHYTINDLPLGTVIKYQFIGMKPVEKVFTSDNKPLNITMIEDIATVGDVIVTGFGVIKKEAYAGSAAMVKLEDMEDLPVSNITDLLTGTASGVEVSSAGGGPGGVNTIRIRGIGSINASSSPLIVVDGIPIRSGSIGTTSSSNSSNFDAMSTINPNDIESMTVIKDAAAASLYGSRAANGVILITTKRGKKGDAKIKFRQDIGFTDFSIDYRPFITGQERYDFIHEGIRRSVLHTEWTPDWHKKENGNAPVDRSEQGATEIADREIQKIVVQRDKDGNPVWTNWEDELFRTGMTVNTELSVSGATDRLNYFSSLGYSKQEGISKIQEMDRYSARLNVEYKALKNLTVGAKTSFSSTIQDYGYDNMGYYSPVYSHFHKITASDPVFDENGQYNHNLLSNGRRNPAASGKYDTRERRVKRFTGNFYAELKLLEDLKLRSTLSYDYSSLVESSFDHPLGSDWDDKGINQGSASKTFRNSGDLVSSTNLNYVTKFGDDHSFDALVAYEATRFDRDRVYAQRKQFLDPNKHDLTAGSELTGASGYGDDYRMISIISRVNYDYKDKIYAGASYRTDGTSRYTAANRWGHFWSLSAGWRFTSEKFMERARDVLRDGRIRVSYGVNGNLTSSYYGGYNRFDLGRYNEGNTLSLRYMVSDDFRWEKNAVLNVGLDLNFIDRINVSLDFYDRRTSDLILDRRVTQTSGFSYVSTNIGKVLNRGFEFEINTRNIVTKNFTWNTSFNFSTNYNEVLKLDGELTEMSGSGNNLARIGKSYYNYYLVEYAGVDPANGLPVFYLNKEDSNGVMPDKSKLWNADGSLNTEVGTYKQSSAREVLTGKSSLPKITGGLSNSLRYKWFDLNFLFTFTLGGWSHDSAMQKSRTAGSGASYINQIPTVYRGGWKQPGDKTNVEGWFYGNANKEMTNSSTARLHRTDHLRLKSLTFGVTLPKNWSNKIGLDRVRFFMAGTNLWTWAANDIYDPETPVNGSVAYETPQLKTLTFGVDITF